MARLRLSITDDPAHQPEGVRVVGRHRFGWVALAGAFAALLCLPVFRNVVLDQAHIVTSGKAPEWLSGITGTAGLQGQATEDPYRARLKSVLQQHPHDVELHLAGVVLGLAGPPVDGRIVEERGSIQVPHLDRDPRLVYLADLRRRFPSSVEVFAASGRFFCAGAINIRRRFVKAGVRNLPKEDHFLDSGVGSEMLAVILEGERLDPQNAYFPTLAAAAYVAMGEDAQGIAAMHRAALCRFWKDYTWAEGDGAERLLTLAYGDRGLFMHATPLAAILLPHYAQVRSVYSVLEDRAGPTPEGWQLRSDMVRVGALMRDGGESLIARLVGAAVQEVAFGTDEIHRANRETEEEMDSAKHQRLAEVVARAERQAPGQAGMLSREADGLIAFRAKRNRIRQGCEMLDRLIQPAIKRELLGLHLLGNLFGCLALWAIASLALFSGAKMPWLNAAILSKRLSRPNYLIVIALAAGALIVPLGAAAVSPANAAFDLGLAFFWLMFVVRPLLAPPGPAQAWTPMAIGATAAATVLCGLAATYPWEFINLTSFGWWRNSLSFLNFFTGEWPSQDGTNPLGYVLAAGPAPLAIFTCACAGIAALRKRAVLSGWLEGVQGVARVLSATLAIGYLIFTLIHVPATLRDGRIASQSFRNETAILDQR